jgi:hypothetical protein
LQRIASECRKWTAQVYDCIALPPPPPKIPTLAPSSSTSSSSNPTTTTSAASLQAATAATTTTAAAPLSAMDHHALIIDKLNQLKEEGLNGLSVTVSNSKVEGLTTLIENLNQWHEKAVIIVSSIEAKVSSSLSSSSSSSSNKQEDSDDAYHIYHVKCLLEEAEQHPCLKVQREYAVLAQKLHDSKPLSMKLNHFLLPAKLRPEGYKKLSWMQVSSLCSWWCCCFFFLSLLACQLNIMY